MDLREIIRFHALTGKEEGVCSLLCVVISVLLLLSCFSQTLQPHRRLPTRLPRPWDSPGKNTGVGCYFLLQCMEVKSESEVAQSCPTPSHPMDCSLPGSSIHGIFQARVLEWVAIPFSNICAREIKLVEVLFRFQKQKRRPLISDLPGLCACLQAHQLLPASQVTLQIRKGVGLGIS